MQKIRTITEAEDFFLRNSSGSVIAVDKDGEEKECDNYPEAVDWIKD